MKRRKTLRAARYCRARNAIAAVVCSTAFVAIQARADLAVEIDDGAFDDIFANVGTTHGWQFTVNSPIAVTHLGLYDKNGDGFQIEHPVALWESNGALLAQVIMSAGADDALVDQFRFKPIGGDESGPDRVILDPGVRYTIGYYTATLADQDGMVFFDGSHTINPIVDYIGWGVADFTKGLELPNGPDFTAHRWGPNFKFEVVPAPGGLALIALAGVSNRRRRTRRG